MFYTGANILLISAVLPGLVLMGYIYRQDKIEPEPRGLLFKLFVFGILSIVPACILESVLIPIAANIFGSGYLFLFVETFLIMALAEEGSKYFFLKKGSWRHPAFNYRFDAVVYAVSVSLGFAIFENIGYVFSYGIQVALIRAITAVPAHTIFAIYMGHYYGLAKQMNDNGYEALAGRFKKMALYVPLLLHGTYDFIASINSGIASLAFWVFLIILDVKAFRRLRRDSQEDVPV